MCSGGKILHFVTHEALQFFSCKSYHYKIYHSHYLVQPAVFSHTSVSYEELRNSVTVKSGMIRDILNYSSGIKGFNH